MFREARKMEQSISSSTPLKAAPGEPFHVVQLDDEGRSFSVSEHLDVRGMTCPMPALKCLERSKALKAAEVLEVIGDWPGSKYEVPYAVAGKAGLEVVRIIESDIPDDETWWIYVRKI
jgi:TusA-related sulfurtransferase